MPERQERGRAQAGCVFGLITLLVGVGMGIALTLSVLGLSFDVLLQGARGNATAVVAVLPTSARPEPMQGQAAPGRRLVWSAPLALDSDTSDPDMLVISRNFDREPDNDTLTYLSPDRASVRWESQPLGDNGNSWVVTYGDTMVLVADEARLIALRRDNGVLAWEAPLTDAIAATICRDCLQVFGDVAVALPQDGVVQAFRLSTGAPLWNLRLREPTRQLVRVGELVGVPDELPDDISYGALYLYDPRDGSPQGEIMPSCDEQGGYERRVSYYMDVGYDPGGRTLIWLVPSSPVCLLSYDVATGAISRTMLEEFTSSDLEPRSSLWAGDTLYLSDTERIYAVGPQERRLLLSAEDYDLWPLAANERVLLVEAQRTRGSTRSELWVVDAASGERLWERVLLGDDPLLEREDDTGNFTATLLGDSVALVEQNSEGEQIVYELLGLSDGASRVRTVLAVADPDTYIRGVTWGRKHVFLSINELYGVELTSGRTAYSWP